MGVQKVSAFILLDKISSAGVCKKEVGKALVLPLPTSLHFTKAILL